MVRGGGGQVIVSFFLLTFVELSCLVEVVCQVSLLQVEQKLVKTLGWVGGFYSENQATLTFVRLSCNNKHRLRTVRDNTHNGSVHPPICRNSSSIRNYTGTLVKKHNPLQWDHTVWSVQTLVIVMGWWLCVDTIMFVPFKLILIRRRFLAT